MNEKKNPLFLEMINNLSIWELNSKAKKEHNGYMKCQFNWYWHWLIYIEYYFSIYQE